jgi:pheromone shutdown protein TraB
VIEWDSEVNRSAGFARLQIERERHIAKRLREVAETANRVLAVVEVERARGVLEALRP